MAGPLQEANASIYRKRYYSIGSARDVLVRLKAAAIEFGLIALLFIGFVVAALCALDLSGTLRW